MAKKPAGDAEAEERRRLRSLAAEQRRLAGPGVAREGSAVEALPPSPPPLSSVTLGRCLQALLLGYHGGLQWQEMSRLQVSRVCSSSSFYLSLSL
jgi:hypothetical protein